MAPKASAPPDAARAAEVVAIGDLAHGYRGRLVVEIRSWTVAPGQHTVILGPPGSGKSTLLHPIAGLPRPDRGRLRVAGQDLGVPDRARGSDELR